MNRSMEAITWAMHARGLGPVAWRMLMTLANRVNNDRDDFDVWPSHRQTADDCEISVATVKRHLKELVDAGYLDIVEQSRGDGSRTSNRYRLAVRKLLRMPDRDIAVRPQGPVQTVSYPPGQNEPGARSLLNHAMNLPIEPIQEEPNPPLPSVEEPPQDLLDGVNLTPAPIRITEHVLAGWRSLAEQFPRIQGIRVLNEARKKKIGARAAEVIRGAGSADLTPHAVWDQIFAAIRGSPFLRGEADPGRGYTDPMSLNIDYILRPAEFLRTLERAATDADHNRVTSDPATGRRFGPAEQAGREALQRYLAGKQRR